MNLRVLMYHSTSATGPNDDLTVDVARLEAHFAALARGGYTTLLMSELLAMAQRMPNGLWPSLPPRSVLLTFDDGFRDNFEIAYPLAVQYGVKLNFFIVPTFIREGSYRGKPCMTREELLSMDPDVVEFGLHSYAHTSYGDLSSEEMGADIRRCKAFFAAKGIPYQPCVAYPYGAYPQDVSALVDEGIRFGFRIGNRLNPWPLQHPYLIQRMDIRGTDPRWTFRAGLRVGRKWLPF
ncbi:polysaccharide deacetylase family protein [Dinghuibacter silviterrae]|uniref:Peptidoglycan/xylan/chitin deacetylase (PgdA/CDA1 family) n=1 Tax=Dinghuibacter silviterrae TaxID=1539049 RepID=A0A4R8DUE3_9BACT|nr:polysaccharide deacetylase family protein [Dinghuibacter silviterrae]TDX01992.1 peptidoglycan/xylan/chitin deacetylase (PgdA/CDA1 family) [Dinghuibacter silviterrae]